MRPVGPNIGWHHHGNDGQPGLSCLLEREDREGVGTWTPGVFEKKVGIIQQPPRVSGCRQSQSTEAVKIWHRRRRGHANEASQATCGQHLVLREDSERSAAVLDHLHAMDVRSGPCGSLMQVDGLLRIALGRFGSVWLLDSTAAPVVDLGCQIVSIPHGVVGPRENRHMTTTATDWLPIIFTTLGGGAVGAVVTTFGGQARTRRKVRAKILKHLRQVEVARIAAFEDFYVGEFRLDRELIDDLETRCMLAGVPRFAVRTYRLAYESARMARKSVLEEKWVPGRPSMLTLTSSFMEEAAKLVAATVWHPWLSWLTVQGECAGLKETIELAFPDIHVSDNWSRQTIRRWRRVMVLRRHPLARRRMRREAEVALAARRLY